MKLFIILRVDDVSGSSGTGRIAEGMVSSDGQVVIFFADSIKIFPSVEKMMEIHSHGGRTRVHFVPALPKAKQLEREWFALPLPKKAGMYLMRKPGVKAVVVQITPEYEADTYADINSEYEERLEDIQAGDHDEVDFAELAAEMLEDRTTWVVSFGPDPDHQFTLEEFREGDGEWTPLQLPTTA